jgi:hypothetical protein
MRKLLPFIQVLVVMAVIYQLFSGVFPPMRTAAATTPRIVRLDSRFDRIVPKEAVVEKLADGFAWVEGPVWNRAGGFLLFSDVPNNSIIKWKPGEGTSPFLKRSGYTGVETFPGHSGSESRRCAFR